MLNKKECWVCGNQQGLHTHEIYFGTGNRKLSLKHGMQVYLCGPHHNLSQYGVHQDRQLDLRLKEWGQEKFEEMYPNESFIKIFGRNYL